LTIISRLSRRIRFFFLKLWLFSYLEITEFPLRVPLPSACFVVSCCKETQFPDRPLSLLSLASDDRRDNLLFHIVSADGSIVASLLFCRFYTVVPPLRISRPFLLPTFISRLPPFWALDSQAFQSLSCKCSPFNFFLRLPSYIDTVLSCFVVLFLKTRSSLHSKLGNPL